MALPSVKSNPIEDFITNLNNGKNRKKFIQKDICIDCKNPATLFDDALSLKEYSISGLCQTCQNEIWG